MRANKARHFTDPVLQTDCELSTPQKLTLNFFCFKRYYLCPINLQDNEPKFHSTDCEVNRNVKTITFRIKIYQ